MSIYVYIYDILIISGFSYGYSGSGRLGVQVYRLELVLARSWGVVGQFSSGDDEHLGHPVRVASGPDDQISQVSVRESATLMMVKSCAEKKVFSIFLNVKYVSANWLCDLL